MIESLIQNALFSSQINNIHTFKKYEDFERFYMDCKNYVQTSRITRIFIDTFISQCVHMRKKDHMADAKRCFLLYHLNKNLNAIHSLRLFK